MKLLVSVFLLSAYGSGLAQAIVGGRVAPANTYTYQVSIQTSEYRCGGSILDNYHILTTARCVEDITAQRLRVRAGSTQHASGGKLFGVASITKHPEYDAKTMQNDIAILQLKESIEFGSTISPVKLLAPGDEAPGTGAKCDLTGWGATSGGSGSRPANLLITDVNIISREECGKSFTGSLQITESMICTGVSGGGKGACTGDSGGPVIDESSSKQVGIISLDSGCGRKPDVHTSVAAYSAWIKDNTVPPSS